MLRNLSASSTLIGKQLVTRERTLAEAQVHDSVFHMYIQRRDCIKPTNKIIQLLSAILLYIL